MKTLYLLFFINMLCLSVAQAQITYTIVDGNTTGYELPMDPYYGYSYSEQIYLQSEVNVSGDISKIQFKYNGYQSFSDNVKIYMGHTAKNSFSSTSDWIKSANMTLVYDGLLSVSSNDWVEITLDQVFTYNNTDNLVIALDENTPGYHSSQAYFYVDAAASNRSLIYRNDNVNPDPANPPTATYRYSYLSNLKLDITSGPIIQLSTASISGLNSCVGQAASSSVAFNVSGASLTDNINLSVGSDFELSTDNQNFSTSINLVQSAGVVNTDVYVRLKAGLTEGNYNGVVTATSPSATDQTLTVSGKNSATSIYVSASASAGGNGSQASPFRTLTEAVALANTASCGATTIYVAAGNYSDTDILIDQSNLTIEGDARTNTIFDGVNNNLRFMSILGSSVSLKSLQIRNYGLPVSCNVIGACDGGALLIGDGTTSYNAISLEDIDLNNNITDGTYGSGGAIMIEDNAVVTINRSYFYNNAAGDPSTTGSNVVNNGGAIYCLGELVVNNSLFYSNISKGYGSAIFLEGSSTVVDLYHCTVSKNNARGNYGALTVKNGFFSLYNSVAYGNVHGITGSQGNDLYESSGLMNLSYSCYGDDYFNRSSISNSLNTDPLFTNSAGNDFSLQSSSPVVDAGLSTYGLSTDIQLLGRPSGAGYDMGAYEYSSCNPPVMSYNVIENCGSSTYSIELTLTSYGDGSTATLSDGNTSIPNANLNQLYTFGPYSIAVATDISANAVAAGGCIANTGNLSGCIPNTCVDAIDLSAGNILADFSLATNDSQESDSGGEPNFLQVGNGTTIASCASGFTHNAYDYTEYKDLWYKVVLPAGEDEFSLTFTNVNDYYVVVPYYGTCGNLTQMTLLYNTDQSITGVIDNDGNNWFGDDPYITPAITHLDFKGSEILNAPNNTVYLRFFPYDGGQGGSSGCNSSYFSTRTMTINSSVAPPVTRTTVQNGSWTNPATWDCNCLPASSDNLVINHNVSLGSNYNVSASASLTINASKTLTISPAVTLSNEGGLTNLGDIDGDGFLLLSGLSRSLDLGTVSNVEVNMTNETINLLDNASVSDVLRLGGGTLDAGAFFLTLESDANTTALIHDNGGTFAGEVIAKRYIQNTLGHHFLGTPVDNATINEIHDNIPLLLTANYPNIYYYDETNPSSNYMDGWLTPSSLSYPMNNGVGFTVYANASNPINVDFVGNPNTGLISRTLTYTPSINPDTSLPYAEGWNLMANPYPSPIDFDLLAASLSSNIEQAYYTWDPNSSSYNSYVNGIASPVGFDQYIQLAQGFWLRTTVDQEQLDFDNTIRVTDPSLITNPFLRPLTISSNPIARISLVGDHSNCETVFSFSDDATADYDLQFDAHFLEGEQFMRVDLASVLTNNGRLRINSQPRAFAETSSTPLYHKVSEAGTFSIKLTEFENFNIGTELTLEDTKLGLFHDLLDDPYYFQSDPNDDERRFILHFGALPSAVESITGIQVKVYVAGNHAVVDFSQAIEQDQNCVIIDQLGRLIYQGIIPAGTNRYEIPMPNQVKNQLYFLQLPKMQQTYKIISR